MKLYLFAIGGSGARVLRSLTMLLAAGVELPEGTELVPIILDPDQGAGNLTETVELLKRYQEIRQEVGDVEHLTTFTSSVQPLDGQDFLIPLDNVANTQFKDYIGLNTGMSEASSELVKALFSKDNLELDMQVGFKGNPNIGSIVLGQFEGSKVFRDFLHDFSQSTGVDKRIFIISSIFGGTGASGFPTLLKSLRDNRGLIGEAHIGALSLQPYFAVSNDPDSAIDSTTFYAKTRAALSYYRENIVQNGDIDDLYFLGDNTPDIFDNHEGGACQRNDAHFVELAGALSIVHFAHLSPKEAGPSRSGRMYEFGVERAIQPLNFKDLGTTTEKLLARPLTALYLMRRYLYQWDIANKPDAWLRSVQPELDATFIDNLTTFLAAYEQWLHELSQSAGRSFTPIKVGIDDDNNLFDCVELYPVVLGFVDRVRKQNFALYTDRLNAMAKERGEPQTAGEMLNLLSDVSYDLCAPKIGLPG